MVGKKNHKVLCSILDDVVVELPSYLCWVEVIWRIMVLISLRTVPRFHLFRFQLSK